MVQRICPVCDQIMKSPHYCRTCRHWVKNPWVRDVDYYLNERHPQNETNCAYHERSPERTANQSRPTQSRTKQIRPKQATAQPNRPRQSAPKGTNEKKKQINLVLVIVIAIYLTFMLVGNGLIGGVGRLLSGSHSSGSSAIYYEEEIFDTDSAQAAYHELEDEAVIAAGEACNSRGHFDIQGEELLEPLEKMLEGMGYEVEDCYSYSFNEIYDGGESWFDTMISVDLAQGDNDTYQYIEINYDTATGQLHEVDVMMADAEAALEMAISVLEYLEDAEVIDRSQTRSDIAREEIGGAVLQGNNIYCTYGEVEISGFSHNDGCGIYISHIWSE